MTNLLNEVFDDLIEGASANLPTFEGTPSHCVTHGYPIVLHCFPAHQTGLQPYHRDELDTIALEIRNGDISGKRYRNIRIVGHAATWRGLTKDQYRDRAIARARNARDYLKSRLASYGLSYRPKFKIEGRANDKPLRDNMVHSTGSTARRNREINRRVEIFLDRGGKAPRPNPRPKPRPETDWDAFLDTKLLQLGDYWDIHRPFEKDRVHACIRRKLLSPQAEDSVVVPIGRAGAYTPPSSGPYVPEVRLRAVLIRDLKKGYARGAIRNFDTRFDIAVSNAIKGVRDLGFRATGADIYNRGITRAMRSVTRRSERKRHVYSCRFFRELIREINSNDIF